MCVLVSVPLRLGVCVLVCMYVCVYVCTFEIIKYPSVKHAEYLFAHAWCILYIFLL